MTQILQDIFLWPIDRPIDGVIKADDEAGLKIELEEYVVTGEIGQRLGEFLDAYNNFDTSNGVWISGFFGSGKSHLLKILALVLENREVDGKRALDFFSEKLKDEPMLIGALRKAVSIPSKSILFNIDQKADIISKSEADALLAVFLKVFDESCGYYGKQPHIARFERELDGRGQLEQFKAAYEKVSGKPWERGREQALLEDGNIATALAEATSSEPSEAKGILDKYRQETRVSIEDFANMVKSWIDSKQPNFRLNFFVDEVGQYIAENVKLMTNLQTIAESLFTKCKGQAWIIVTAQQELASVVGDMTKKEEIDFSKIQARFNIRIPLNSADVAEVIQLRLLSKTDEGSVVLRNLHDRQQNNFGTLFDFTDGSLKLKNYRDRDHFVNSHPFPPFQYTLFQMALSALSDHNAFEGKHSSVGERSMLGVFQDVAKKLMGLPIERLASFDLMFEGIRTALKSSVQQSIQIAEREIEGVDSFALRVLKVLFLVKYVRGFKPSIRNIGILLLGGFDDDQAKQNGKIEESLALLERNTLVQRNGDAYEFLTNEEKDVENEIKAMEIDEIDLSKELDMMVFDTILKHRKMKYTATGFEYPFTRRLDDHVHGREQELSINLLSPFSEDSENFEAARMNSLNRDELSVMTGPNTRFVQDMIMYMKTVKFIRQNRSSGTHTGIDRIIAEKGEQNGTRAKDLEIRMRELLITARLFVRGEELEIRGEDPQERIVKAFQALVEKVYTSLPMLRGINYTEADIARTVEPENSLLRSEGDGISEAELDMLSYIEAQDRNGVKVTAKNLIDRFSAKPYGWPSPATLCFAGGLVALGRVEARYDSVVIEGAKLASVLGNNNALTNVLLTPQTEFSAAQLRKSKELCQALFSKPSIGTDMRTIGDEWREGVGALLNEVDELVHQKRDYPFLTRLKPLQERLSSMKGKAASWFITEPAKHEDELLDSKEEILDKIRAFMSGAQKEIYDDARDFVRAQKSNIDYVDAETGLEIRTILDEADCYIGASIQNLKSGVQKLKQVIEIKILHERKAVAATIDEVEKKLLNVPEFIALLPEQQEGITRMIDAQRNCIENLDVIAALRDRCNDIASNMLGNLLSEAAGLSPMTGQSNTHKDTYVNIQEVKPNWPNAYLSDKVEVEKYMNSLKNSLLNEIDAGKKVIL